MRAIFLELLRMYVKTKSNIDFALHQVISKLFFCDKQLSRPSITLHIQILPLLSIDSTKQPPQPPYATTAFVALHLFHWTSASSKLEKAADYTQAINTTNPIVATKNMQKQPLNHHNIRPSIHQSTSWFDNHHHYQSIHHHQPFFPAHSHCQPMPHSLKTKTNLQPPL